MTISKLRRLAVAILAAATATAGLLPLGSAPASAVAGFTWDRIDGTDRFDTARRIALETFGSANTVLLARADIFPDALSGSYLAGSTDGGAPILLTEVNRLPNATNEALASLGTTRIILLGGPNAISPAVEAELRSRNFQVERIGGRDRFETSQQVSERLGSSNVGSVDADRTAIVASGRNFPDALAGGPLAFASRLPIVLSDTNTLPQPSRNALTNLSIERVFLLGGPNALSSNVETQLRDMGLTVERLGGANRQGTAVIIAETAIERLGFDDTHINLARGDNFADALSGGPHAGDESDGGSQPGAPPAPIVLALAPNVLSAETSAFLRNHSDTLRDGHIFGGLSAVNEAVADEAAEAAGAGRTAVTIDADEVEAGDTITGNVSGDPDEVFVTGCGFNDDEVNLASDGDFSLTIPESQPAGDCTLTFRITFTDGSEEVDSVVITITAPLVTATDAPELIRVTFVRSFVQQTSGGDPYDQTVMRYTFDETVTGQALLSADTTTNACTVDTAGCSLKFKLYSFNQAPAPPGTSNEDPPRVFLGRTAQIDPSDNNSVLVTFGQSSSLPPARDLGQAELADITLAAVDQQAVRDSSNVFNPFGDASLNTLIFAPGRTVAPDLLSVTNLRPNFDGTRTLADFTFDEPAVPTRLIAEPAGEGYALILNDADATERPCFYQSGSGTSTLTVSCPTVGLTQIAPSSVARGTIESGTVASPDSSNTDPEPEPDEGQANPLQATDVTGEGATSRPDLVSATFFTGNADGTPSASYDQVVYTFDEPVLEPTTAQESVCDPEGVGEPADGRDCFVVYAADGEETYSGAAGIPEPVRSSSNDTDIIVSFPDGTIEDATGASVMDGAVLEAVGTGGVNRTNREDEVAVQGVTYTAGLTTAPDFVACELEATQRDPISGNPTAFRLVFVFDENVGSSMSQQHFYVYDAAGNKITPKTSTGTLSGTTDPRQRPGEPDEVHLAGFAFQSDLQNIRACAVDDRAVLSAETPAEANPIGYEVLS